MPYDVSIIIGTYNLKDKLLLVLDAFNKQDYPLHHFEVIVVDSNSNDGTKEKVKQKKYNFELVFMVQENRGKASARNTGIKLARAKTIIITDADMIPECSFVSEHMKIHKANELGIIVQGKTWVLSQEKLPAQDYKRRPYIKHKVNNLQKLDFYYFLTGNLSLPKKYFEDYGFFDEQYAGYGWEDIDLGYKMIRKHRLAIVYGEFAENYHYHVWTEKEELLRREKMGESVHLLINKYPELKTFLGINIFNKFIYKILGKRKRLINKWLDNFDKYKNNKFVVIILREYFYQQGYVK